STSRGLARKSPPKIVSDWYQFPCKYSPTAAGNKSSVERSVIFPACRLNHCLDRTTAPIQTPATIIQPTRTNDGSSASTQTKVVRMSKLTSAVKPIDTANPNQAPLVQSWVNP